MSSFISFMTMILYCFHSAQHSLQHGYAEANGSSSTPSGISFLHLVLVLTLMKNVVGLFFTQISPPWLFMIVWQLANPKPVPRCFVVNNGSNIFDMYFSGIPGPVSVTLITNASSLSSIDIVIFPDSPIACIELMIKLDRTISS